MVYRSKILLSCSAGVLALTMAGCSQPFGLTPGADPNMGATLAPPHSRTRDADRAASLPAADRNPNITSGLLVVPEEKWALQVQPGACSIGGKDISVHSVPPLEETPTQPLIFKAVPVMLPDKVGTEGAPLKDARGVAGALDVGSVTVWNAAAEPRRAYKPAAGKSGGDYVLDSISGTIARSAGSSIPLGAPVYIDYSVRQQRIDTVQVHADGTVDLKKGAPATTEPQAPAADAGCLAIAHIFIDFGTTKLTPDLVYTIGADWAPPTEQERQAMAAAVSRTRAKLQADGKVTVALWGNLFSHPAGAPDAHTLPAVLTSTLQARYKGAQVNVVNAGTTGDIRADLPTLSKDVLGSHPDLVVVGFTDPGRESKTGDLKKDYTTAVNELKQAGSEVVILTPPFEAPELMKMRSARDRDTRPVTAIIREIGRTEKVGVADVSKRWEHLAVEGVPYVTLLADRLDHPDELGRSFTADAVQSFF